MFTYRFTSTDLLVIWCSSAASGSGRIKNTPHHPQRRYVGLGTEVVVEELGALPPFLTPCFSLMSRHVRLLESLSLDDALQVSPEGKVDSERLLVIKTTLRNKTKCFTQSNTGAAQSEWKGSREEGPSDTCTSSDTRLFALFWCRGAQQLARWRRVAVGLQQ